MEADQRRPYCPSPEESASTRGFSSRASAERPEPESSESPPKFDGFRRALDHLGEYKEYASYYMAAKIDGMKGSVRNVGIYAGLGIVGLMAVKALIATAVALFLIGAALGLAHAFGDPPRYWLGALMVGLAILVLIGVGAAIALSRLNAGFRKAAENKYEQRKRWQRGQFGRDVEQAAATAKPKPEKVH